MMCRTRMVRIASITLGICLLMGFTVLAEDEQEGTDTDKAAQVQASEPAAEQPILKSEKAPAQGSSLAAAASKIRLQQPSGEGGLVISNATLKKTEGQGSVSVGGGVTASGAPTQKPGAGQGATSAVAAGSSNPLNALVEQYNQQKNVVLGLETRLKNYDEQLAKPSRDPHYPYLTHRPEDRAGGVQDPAKGQRDILAKRLDEERRKLDGLREQARRAGVKLQ